MAATNFQSTTKKIKPIQHPQLVLQTPIAYHSDSDLSVLPIDRNGIAICQNCGAIGVKHAFYTRQRRFCSMTCSRQDISYYKSQKNSKRTPGSNEEDGTNHGKKQVNYRFKFTESSERMAGMIPLQPLPQIPALWQASLGDFMQQTPIKTVNVNNSYLWGDQLFACDFLAAPVKLFRHAPLSDMWDNVFEGMKVEVKNRDCEKKCQSDYFWVATVLKLKGYMGLLRYEGFGNDNSKDFWMNLMHPEVHPVGWCATRGKPLIPPQTIENKHPDWKSFLVRQLTGARTLPADFYTKISESLKSRFRAGHTLEVVDKNRISQVKVATVHGIVGKRLHVRYYDSGPDDDGFWCHEDSPLIHPVGWARAVGHLLDAPADYVDRLDAGTSHPDDATADLFKYYLNEDPHDIDFEPNFTEGMKIEAIDHLNLSSVCAATVMRVLLHGHIMIRIDCYPPDETGGDWFCYHERSPCIFPAGFCAERGIPLTLAAGQPPLLTTPRSALPPLPPHGFISGMRLECADLMDPRLVCVARVSRVVGRLIKVHFDGWGDEYDQWLDCESTDIYPVGWCGAVGHRLEAPFVPAKQPAAVLKKRGRKKKGGKMIIEQQKPSLVNPISEFLDTSNNHETNQNHPPSVKEDILCDNFNSHTGDIEDFQSTSNMDNIMNLQSTPDIDDIDDVMKLQSTSDLDDIMKLESASDIDEIIKLDSVRNVNGVMKMQSPNDLEDDVKLESSKLHSLDAMMDDTHGNDIILDDNLDFDITDIDDKPNFDSIESKHCLDNAMNITDEPLDDIELVEPEIGITPIIPKVIPRLVGNFTVDSSILNSVDPESWDPDDVARFLSTNDCAPYCQNFCQITGKVMLELTKDEIIELLQMKVGPSLKIFDLIQQLKCKLKPAQARIKNSFK